MLRCLPLAHKLVTMAGLAAQLPHVLESLEVWFRILLVPTLIRSKVITTLVITYVQKIRHGCVGPMQQLRTYLQNLSWEFNLFSHQFFSVLTVFTDMPEVVCTLLTLLGSLPVVTPIICCA